MRYPSQKGFYAFLTVLATSFPLLFFHLNYINNKVFIIYINKLMNSFVQPLNMKALMESDDYVNNTDRIRDLKHSESILADIGKLCEIKKTHFHMRMVEEEKYNHLCQTSAPFLFNNYTDIFNKVLKDELNMELMVKFVFILKQIEDGIVDQYDASVKVGTILKEMYVDSAMRRGDNLDKEHAAEAPVFVEPVKISWKDFKEKEKRD